MAWTRESLTVTPPIAAQVVAQIVAETRQGRGGRELWGRISRWLLAGKRRTK